MAFKYRMVRVVCKGVIKSCDRCLELSFNEGYCPQCGRPLWKKPEEVCNTIVGYVEGDVLEQKQGKINIRCRYCNSLTTI